jgi:hypothetical protein
MIKEYFMSGHRKTFQCGHKGYGQICHRCLQQEQVDRDRRIKKQDWRDSFDGDPIDLDRLPAYVVLKARGHWSFKERESRILAQSRVQS